MLSELLGKPCKLSAALQGKKVASRLGLQGPGRYPLDIVVHIVHYNGMNIPLLYGSMYR